jgi:anti-sigma regulatory factor (Ser/Thr protein kinase)
MDGVSQSLAFDATSTAPGAARRFTREALLALRGESAMDDAELLVSELVTNAVQHSPRGGTLRISRLDDALHFEVVDYGSGSLEMQTPDVVDPSGRGLGIVDHVAIAWGVTPLPDGESGKAVWFVLVIAHPAP